MLRNFIRTMSTVSGDTQGGPLTQAIISKVQSTFHPSQLQIYNDSHKHAHHASMRGSTNIQESHFRLTIVSNEFEGKSQPIRHRQVYALFKDEMSMPNGIHALQLSTKTEKEWNKLQNKE